MANPFSFLESINYTKTDLTIEDPMSIKDYNPFLINRSLSMFIDTIFFSNEMNIHHNLDKDQQYDYLLSTINKRKRFSKWIKPDTTDNLELIKKIYMVNNSKAVEILKLLTKDKLNMLNKNQEKGGISK